MIHVIGSSKNNFILSPFREKFVVDEPHEGDNIDNMNPWYCEITGLYHLWKNDKDDVVGLEHYRRYFLDDTNKIMSEEAAREKLKDCDVLLRRFIFKDYGQRDGFWWMEKDDVMKYFIEFLYQLHEPDFAMFCLHELETEPEFAQCNMFIAKRPAIDTYCTWLFSKLEQLDFSKFKEKQRIIGYLTEFIFQAWLKYHGYKTKYARTVTFVPYDFNKVIEVTPNDKDK